MGDNVLIDYVALVVASSIARFVYSVSWRYECAYV